MTGYHCKGCILKTISILWQYGTVAEPSPVMVTGKHGPFPSDFSDSARGIALFVVHRTHVILGGSVPDPIRAQYGREPKTKRRF